jgi:uncharacterized membrane protein
VRTARPTRVFSTLKQLDAQGRARLMVAAVVTRGDDGRVLVKDQVGADSYAGTAGGGLIGLLVGFLGGPLGVLIGGATGLLLGSLYDLDDVDETESALSEVSETVQVGRTALLAHVIEEHTEVIDAEMALLTGKSSGARSTRWRARSPVRRRPSARPRTRRARSSAGRGTRAEAHAKVEELKSKLHHQREPATTNA